MRLLLPPGLGDLHWCMLKMQGFIERDLGGPPKVFVASNDPSKNRSEDYIKALPFVTWGGYVDIRKDRASFTRAFTGGQRLRDYRAPDGRRFDLFYSNNQDVEQGRRPVDWFPSGVKPDFDYPLDLELPFRSEFHRYVILSLYRHGWYDGWWKHFTPAEVIKGIREAMPGHTIIITGAKWDRPVANAIAKKHSLTCIAGETTLEQFLGIIKGANLFVGHAAGNAMMAVHLKVPTVMLWGDPPFRRTMWSCWAPPKAKHYVPFDVRGSHSLASAIKQAVR